VNDASWDHSSENSGAAVRRWPPDCPQELAPIVLFVYNRPEHTRRTVASLCANDLARQSRLYVFADGPKRLSAAEPVEAVRAFIRTIDGFESVTIIERERNLGLAASVIAGVTQLFKEFGRVIVVEDDLLTAPDFLTFMNSALERYAADPQVFSASAFNFAVQTPETYPYDAFFAYRSSSWGWGTWKDRWLQSDWEVSDYAQFKRDKGRQRLFNRGGEDLSDMLAAQMSGEIDSWAIRWAYNHFAYNAASLLSTVSRVYNTGLDGSGVHCRRAPFQQASLTSGTDSVYRFPDSVDFNSHFINEIQRRNRRSLVRRAAERLRRIVPSRTLVDSNRILSRHAKHSAERERSEANR
jgi:GNT-I family